MRVGKAMVSGVALLALVAGALGGLFAGGFTVNIKDDAIHFDNRPLDEEGPL